MVGYYSSTMVVGGGGPGQAPVFQYRYFISINYVGGQNIKVISAAKLPTRFDTLTFDRVQSPAPIQSRTVARHLIRKTPTCPTPSIGRHTRMASLTSGTDVQLIMRATLIRATWSTLMKGLVKLSQNAMLTLVVRGISIPARRNALQVLLWISVGMVFVTSLQPLTLPGGWAQDSGVLCL
jgi:RNase P/RNase MRP subunit p30